ncbi:WD-REPEATS-REGION domain-containing protein [Mycena sanguinolenta]|uniref:WD-REPEATS-REGION domain-containing protein n=1 Tax=Mycena sanguinolenta TaxID=230812 RepID=A0A8H6XQP8_9AGAR|nr:WD-REPEATS-REGION domain-containing protein [Mycena sanguinolenta]
MSTSRQGPFESTSRLALDEWGEDGLQEASLIPDNRKGRLSLRTLLNSESPERELEPSRDNLVRSTTNFYGNISGGTGGRGGSGGEGGGSGGRGEGPLFIAHQQVFYSSTDAANLLKDLGLKYVSARYNAAETTAQRCMEGTRVDIIQEIVEQLTRPPDPLLRLVLCSGPAGSGKSTIAKTVAARLEEEEKILAASFFFSRDYAERKELTYLPCTLAHQLADYNSEFQHLLVKLLKDDRSRLVHADPKEQFQKMIVELLAKMPSSRTPWVICLDALDECGKDHGKVLLRWLSDAMANIPVHIRFFLTGRPEVCHYLTFNLSVLCKYSNIEAINPETVRKDIHFYVAQSLKDPTWNESTGGWEVNEKDVDKITSQANGLFIFAATAVRYVHARSEDDIHPQKSVDILLKGDTHPISLDDLYFQIIGEVIGTTVEAFERTKKVLNAIVGLVEPQNMETLAGLLEIDVEELQRTLIRLSAVLSVPGSAAVIKIIHLSFREFLTGRIGEKWPKLSCGTEAQQHYLGHCTLCVMQQELKFNICHLPTSHARNIDIPDLEQRKQKYISGHLVYSSQFWATHIAASCYSIELAQDAHGFLMDYFLFWLEVLSLIGAVGSAVQTLSKFLKWSDEDPGMVETIEFARDGRRFINFFKDAIVQSAPHIYLSALALAPEQSQIVKKFHPQFPCLISAGIGQMDVWPATILVLKMPHEVLSVAFSPDGKQVVSGLLDNTVYVWDAESGEVVAGPFHGHTAIVRSVAFSPNGKHIVSGSDDETVQVWDAESGEVVAGPFNGHTSSVNLVAFSPDGKWIVSGSSDNTVCVWNAKSGEVVAGPFHGHTATVRSVAFSPNGKHIVSGSDDKTVQVWDAESGEVVAGPFNVAFSPNGKLIVSGSHDNTVCVVFSVAFSPNGKWIASGSLDHTVCVWDAEIGEVVARFSGHTSLVYSVAFSPDGKQIVSGSADRTVRIWDAESREVDAGPFHGHTDVVNSVAFSPNGKQIVSGSHDKTVFAFSPDGKQIVSGSYEETVYVWDTEHGELAAGLFNSHESTVSSATFSPDGQWVVSGSWDNTVCVWDAKSGEVVFQKDHTRLVNSVAFSPDSKQIVSGSDDLTVCPVTSVAFSPNGKWIVSGSEDKTVCPVTSAVFSPDGKQIVSGSWDHTVRVWDVKSGEVIARFNGHIHGVKSVAFSPDGKWIVSGSADSTVRVWDVESRHVGAEPLKTASRKNHSTCAWFQSLNNTHPAPEWDVIGGWLTCHPDELLVWLPDCFRKGLWSPHNTLVIGRQQTTLIFDKFVHGTEWMHCYSGYTTEY